MSPHTLQAYRRDLNKVLAFCDKESIASWAALDIQRLRQLVSRLHQQGQSSRSIARLLSAVRGLYHYLNREGLFERSGPKVTPTHKAFMMYAEVKSFLEWLVGNHFTFLGYEEFVVRDEADGGRGRHRDQTR